jgi:hypothetical protein
MCLQILHLKQEEEAKRENEKDFIKQETKVGNIMNMCLLELKTKRETKM